MSVEEQGNEFLTLFKRHLNGSVSVEVRLVVCKSVNWDEKTMVADGAADGVPFHNVWLGLGSVTKKPKIGTECVIAVIDGLDGVSILLDAAEVDEIILNNGENGGLTITPELVKQLGKLTARVDGIISALKNAIPVAGAADGGAGLKTSIVTALNTITQKEDFKNIENKRVTH